MTTTPSNPQPESFYDKRYSDEWRQLQDRVFGEAYDDYFGQSSLTTTADYDRMFSWLSVAPGSRALDVACGGGAPSLRLARLTGCSVTGIDNNANATARAARSASENGLGRISNFLLHDANAASPFASESFDAVVCVDALQHIGQHTSTLREWSRVLRPGGRLAFTDMVLTGPISSLEFERRSASGPLVLAPAGFVEQQLSAVGLELEHCTDITRALQASARRHVQARSRHADDLRKLEGEAMFEMLNRYRETIELLARERRLSHFAFVATKKAP